MAHIEVDDAVHFSVFDALFRIDPKGVLQPNLAAEVPSQKNGGISEDGLQWRIRLRDDVRWHDGEPFTAEDVKFTLELITNPNFRAWRTSGHSLVRDITVVSPTEITWRMEKRLRPLPVVSRRNLHRAQAHPRERGRPQRRRLQSGACRHRRIQVGASALQATISNSSRTRTISAKVPMSSGSSSNTFLT